MLDETMTKDHQGGIEICSTIAEEVEHEEETAEIAMALVEVLHKVVSGKRAHLLHLRRKSPRQT
jgi:hypothetical protein